MKILFFSYAYPNPVNPGLGTFNRTMIAGLAREHEVRVVSPVPFLDVWKAWVRGRLPHGLNATAFQAVESVPANYCPWYYTPKLFRTQYGRFMRHSVRARLNSTMKEFQPDIVLSYWTHPDGEVAVETAREFGVRAVTMVGGSDVLINGRSGARRTSILNVLHAADGVIAVSRDIKRVLVSDGISDEKLFVVRRGIDRRVFHAGDRSIARQKLGLPDDRPILICVGRLVDVKGHAHLIEACRLLVAKGIQFRCDILGDGPLRSALQNQIAQAGLAGTVELRGSQSPDQLADWYRAADLSVLASLSEGVPNVLLESIACGTPFVASNVGGIPEVADPLLDVLVPAGNPTVLSDAIAARLEMSLPEPRKARCFEPLTVEQSATRLSSILKMIRVARKNQVPDLSTAHEIMREVDSVAGGTSNGNVLSSGNESIRHRRKQFTHFSNEDDLGRTAESFQLKKAISSFDGPKLQ